MEAMSERMPAAERVSKLRGGSTGLGGAVVQSAALIAPAAGATAGFVFIASQSGFASPFAMVVGTIFSLCLAVLAEEFVTGTLFRLVFHRRPVPGRVEASVNDPGRACFGPNHRLN